LLLIDLTADDIAEYQKGRLRERASPKTINLELGTLRAILRRHRLWANVQPDVKMPSVRDDVGKALTTDEEKKLLAACGASRSRALLPVVTLALNTAMRRGELQSLTWGQIDFRSERLTVGEARPRLLEGEKMAPLCAEFGISRKTGYKIFDRYKECGVQAFSDRSHRAHRQANRLPAPIEATIVRLKREYPGWGAPKLREKLRQQFTGPHLPAISTVHAVLDRYHLVKHRQRRRRRATGTELSRPTAPNALWCADYKGEFMLGNRRYCYPLTITDFASRYLLTCEALSTTQEKFAFTVFERAFKEFGLPAGIRTDNGVPFASAHALYGLSKLSVWWLRLGIQIERIQPGHPQQNGRHERMHLTLKREATKPAAPNVLQQQATSGRRRLWVRRTTTRLSVFWALKYVSRLGRRAR